MSFTARATRRGRAQRQRAIGRNVAALSHYSSDNVLQVIAQATPAEEAEGMGWYSAAHHHAAEIAATYGISLSSAAATIAALSPQSGWTENLRLAHEAAEHAQAGRTDLIGGHTVDACTKASQILRGADPRHVLGGRKVRSFYANILRPETPGPVTVDRHAVSILADDRGEERKRTLDRMGAYQHCTALYRDAGRTLGVMPHQAQAISWVTWRRIHDVYRPEHEEF